MGRRRDCAGKSGSGMSLSLLSGPRNGGCNSSRHFPVLYSGHAGVRPILSDPLIRVPRNPREDFFRDGSLELACTWNRRMTPLARSMGRIYSQNKPVPEAFFILIEKVLI
jgi:hypothetical protein